MSNWKLTCTICPEVIFLFSQTKEQIDEIIQDKPFKTKEKGSHRHELTAEQV